MPNGSYEFAAWIKDHSSSKPQPKKYPFQIIGGQEVVTN